MGLKACILNLRPLSQRIRILILKEFYPNLEISLVKYFNTMNDFSCIRDLKKNVSLIYTTEFDLHPLLSYRLSEIMQCSVAALFLLPPFYGDSTRFSRILDSSKLWVKTLYSQLFSEINGITLMIDNALKRYLLGKILGRFDQIIAVSPSILLEMNVSLSNLSILDPGTTLSDEDQKMISVINRDSLSKSNILLYSSRIAPDKGLIEALYSFRIMARKMPSLKLIVTGYLDTSIEKRLRFLARRLGIHDRVEFTEYVSREELFKLKARALVHLYPSHVDSVSFPSLSL